MSKEIKTQVVVLVLALPVIPLPSVRLTWVWIPLSSSVTPPWGASA